jgi:uncharacterized protein YjbI with pentapeptide repeats
MPDSPTSEPESDFVCACEELMRSACAGEPFYKEHEGKRYCVLHYPGKEKIAEFECTLRRKVARNDFNFRGVWFPADVSFDRLEIKAKTDFRNAIFNRAASFRRTTFFQKAAFSDAVFNVSADFIGARFHESSFFIRVMFGPMTSFSVSSFLKAADFHGSTFPEEAYFTGATFSEVNFSEATFGALALFNYARFMGYVQFAGAPQRLIFGRTSSLDLQFAEFKEPERTFFSGLHLRPHWFVRVDPTDFDFTNVIWQWRSTKREIDSLKAKELALPHGLLARTCLRLADNAQENHQYEAASRLRYLAMEARRLESWRGFAPWRLSWWYWLASGYGERVLKAFVVLLGIWFVAGLLYTRVGFARWEPKLASESDIAVAKRDEVGVPLKLSRALTYSAAVMTFQKPEPRPATTAAQTIVLLETILGPVQAALLALAIRRKFMR